MQTPWFDIEHITKIIDLPNINFLATANIKNTILLWDLNKIGEDNIEKIVSEMMKDLENEQIKKEKKREEIKEAKQDQIPEADKEESDDEGALNPEQAKEAKPAKQKEKTYEVKDLQAAKKLKGHKKGI